MAGGHRLPWGGKPSAAATAVGTTERPHEARMQQVARNLHLGPVLALLDNAQRLLACLRPGTDTLRAHLIPRSSVQDQPG